MRKLVRPPLTWGKDRARVPVLSLDLVVYEDGDEKGKWWADIEIPALNGWLSLERDKPFDTKEEAMRAAEAALDERLTLLAQALKGWTTG